MQKCLNADLDRYSLLTPESKLCLREWAVKTEVLVKENDEALARDRERVHRGYLALWREQCEAAKSIRERYGAENALGYLVDEKLMNFAGAAEQRPEFAAELPAFVAEVRKLFTPQKLRDHFAELERTSLFETEPEDEEKFEDDPLDNPAQEVEAGAWLSVRFGSIDSGTLN
jgi:hypothetical protein